MRKSMIRAMVAAGCLAAMALAYGQQPKVLPRRDQDPAPRAPQAGARNIDRTDATPDAERAPRAELLDQFLVQCVAQHRQHGIELAEFARKNSESDEVKQFAQAVIDDNQKMLAALKQIAPAALGDPARTTITTESATAPAPKARHEANERDEREEVVVRTEKTWPAMGGVITKIGIIERQVADACLESAKKKLGEKQGAEFDQCYVAMQVFANQGLLDKLRIYQQHASPEVAQAFERGAQSTETLLARAEQLFQQFGPVAETAQRRTPARQE